MKKEIYNVEGIEIKAEHIDKNDADRERRLIAYKVKMEKERGNL